MWDTHEYVIEIRYRIEVQSDLGKKRIDEELAECSQRYSGLFTTWPEVDLGHLRNARINVKRRDLADPPTVKITPTED
jgi:hypothetical protein